MSSTSSPRERRRENVARNENSIWVIFMTEKVIRNVRGTESMDRNACLIPRNRSSTKKTSTIVMITSRTK